MQRDLGRYSESEFTLVDLVRTAREILGGIAYQLGDGRVAAIPDERTVRYYQTVGLLRKPLRYDGRTAVYGYPHLLQLLAIKLLQVQGLSLAQIQNALIQLSMQGLERQLRIAMDALDSKAAPSVNEEKLVSMDPFSLRQIESHPTGNCEDTRDEWIPVYQKPRIANGRDLIAAEVVPGISVMIDPDKVRNAKTILESLRNFLKTILGDHE